MNKLADSSDIFAKRIRRTSVKKDLPKPGNLEKRASDEKKLYFRFTRPKENLDSFTHYKFHFEHPYRSSFDIIKYVNKNKLIPSNFDGDVKTDEVVYYIEVEDAGFKGGILYTVVIQVMKELADKPNNWIISDATSNGQIMTMRTDPPAVSAMKLTKNENMARSVTLSFQAPAPSQMGPTYNFFSIELHALEVNGTRLVDSKAIEEKSHGAIIYKPTPVSKELKFEKLATGTEYMFVVYTVSDGGAAWRDRKDNDLTKSNETVRMYEVEFEGPKDVQKLDWSSNHITFSFRAEEMTGIDQYRIQVSEMLRNGSIMPLPDTIINATEPNGNYTETYKMEDLDPGVPYLIGLSSIRSEFQYGNESKTHNVYFRTRPWAPDPVNLTIINDMDVQLDDKKRKATVDFSNLEGVVDYVGINYTQMDTGLVSAPKYVKFETTKNFTMTELMPGALYNVSLEVGARFRDLDPTRTFVHKLFRTKPNPPRSARADSTRGTIHLLWHRPEEMGKVSGWQYRIRYILADVKDNEVEQPEEVIKYIPAGQGSNSADIVPRRDSFLSGLLSGRQYKIFIETVAGNGLIKIGDKEYNDTQIVSEPLGPLAVFTQPAQPRIEEWLQITTDHIKIIWSAPQKGRERGGRFDRYYLNVTRRRERYSSIPYKPETYHEVFNPGENFHIMKITAGALYNMTLTSIVGVDQKLACLDNLKRLNRETEQNIKDCHGLQLESIVTPENKRVEVKTWSPYIMHSTFKRLEWKFTSCGQVGRHGPTQDQCEAAYAGENLEKLVQVKRGIQEWMAPIRGLYRIIAAGPGYERTGGLGAKVAGTFSFDQGKLLRIIVGQRGDYFGDMVVGGAGGSYVMSEDQALIIAGGAGSNPPTLKPSPKSNANLAQVGRDAAESSATTNTGLGGIRGGRGSRSASGTGGGAGLIQNGEKPNLIEGPDQGYEAVAVFINGSHAENGNWVPPGTG